MSWPRLATGGSASSRSAAEAASRRAPSTALAGQAGARRRCAAGAERTTRIGRSRGPSSDLSARERVTEIVGHLASTLAGGSGVAACTPALIDAAERHAEIRELFHQYTSERRQPLVDALRDGVAAGELNENVHPELAAVALAGAVMYRRMMTPSPLLPSEVEALVATILGEAPADRSG